MWQDESLLLVKYKFKNIGESAVSDLYFGQHMDFEIFGWDKDMGVWEESQGLNFAYMYDANETNTPYIGVAMFDSTGNYVNNSLSFNVAMRLKSSNEPVFSQKMRNGVIEPGTNELGDYAILISSGPYSLEINESISPFMLAFVAGENPDELKEAVKKSYAKSKNLTNVKKQESIISHNFKLSQNYPNPFNPETTILFSIPEESKVELAIYNVLGQKIRDLIHQNYQTGEHTVKWNGRDDTNKIVNSGIYLLKIKAGEYTDILKMTFMK